MTKNIPSENDDSQGGVSDMKREQENSDFAKDLKRVDSTGITLADIRKKQQSGQYYYPKDPIIYNEIIRIKDLLLKYNQLKPSSQKERQEVIRDILGKCGEEVVISSPFYTDYGKNIYVGEHFFANFNFTVLDGGLVQIGDNAFIGPNVSIYTTCHPKDAALRNKGVEWGEKVTIGDSVWIGGSVVICPGVTIGDEVVIGAGSVVVRDIPSYSVVAGNPSKIVKSTAFLAGGCFWGMEHYLQKLNGVISVENGFMGGHVAHPSYEQVKSHTTGHAETVKVIYDPRVLNYEVLLRYYFEIHDPTQVNQQGIDEGPQYRSEIFYVTSKEKETAEKLIAILKGEGFSVVTRLTDVKQAKPFYPAESYHQDYFEHHEGEPDCHFYVKRFR